MRAQPLSLNRAHPLARQLSVAWVAEFPDREWVSGVATTPTNGPTYGAAWTRGKAMQFTGTTQYLQLLSSTATLPTGPATISLHWRKTDTTNRASGAFGVDTDPSPNNFRINVHLPYSEGGLYFDYGGQSNGSTRLSIAGLTYGDDIWSLTTGARGMEAWQNGILRGSNAGNPTRANPAGGFYINRHIGTDGDLAMCSFLYVHDRQLEPSEIRALVEDPYQIFRPYRRVGLDVTASTEEKAGSDTASLAVSETAELASSSSLSDTASLAVTETAALDAASTVTDTASLAVTETAALDAASSVEDTASLSVDDVALVAVAIDASDDALLSVSETASLEITADAVAAPVYSGGFFFAYDGYAARRKREEEEREEAERQALANEDETAREIAAFLHRQEAEDAKRRELDRLAALVQQFTDRAAEEAFNERVQKAYANALAKQNAAALLKLQQELERQLEEEEAFVLMVIASDD